MSTCHYVHRLNYVRWKLRQSDAPKFTQSHPFFLLRIEQHCISQCPVQLDETIMVPEDHGQWDESGSEGHFPDLSPPTWPFTLLPSSERQSREGQ